MAQFKNEHLTRQADIIPTSVLGERITIIGAGAVGSWTTLALAKMGFCNLTVIDFDDVSVENMNSQFYPFSAIGKSKASALQAMVKDFTNVEIKATQAKYLSGIMTGIVISAVDSMAVRRTIFEEHQGKSFGTRAIVDARMGAEYASCFVVKPMDRASCAEYAKTLYSDENAIQVRCTEKATVYGAFGITALVVAQVKALVLSLPYSKNTQWAIAQNDFDATQIS